MRVFAVLYGVPVWGFAVLWIALATALTIRTLRRGMPFALTWWSLTFPVGTFVTGTTQLAIHTGLPAFEIAAVAAYAGLLCTWALVAARIGTIIFGAYEPKMGACGSVFAHHAGEALGDGLARRCHPVINLTHPIQHRGALVPLERPPVLHQLRRGLGMELHTPRRAQPKRSRRIGG